MSHWAEINEDNLVIRVIVGDNNDPNGDEGYQWILDNLGGTWVKTSYNNNIRKNFASTGFTYDPDTDVFTPPQPFPSWTLNEQTANWEAPTPRPEDVDCYWDEATLSWLNIQKI